MPSGGARAVSGPPPDPNALRRDRDNKEWTTLPARREGDVPTWPLTRPTAREVAIWADLWTMPQAVMWERSRQHTEVALYVRSLKEAEESKASPSLRTLVKQQMEALGLSQPGMLRLRWRVEDVRPEAPVTHTRSERSARERLRLLKGA